MKKQITVHQAVISFLHDCKDNQLPIETLVAYENTLCDFFGGTGTEFIEDITQGSQIEYIGSVSVSGVEEYKDRQNPPRRVYGGFKRRFRAFESVL